MSNFPSFYLKTILVEAGWPRERGRFRKKAIVNAMMVDLTLSHLTRLGVVLGAGRPELALRLIAAHYVPDETWPTILEAIEEDVEATVTAAVTAAAAEGGRAPAGGLYMFDERLPLEAMVPHPWAEVTNEVPWKDLFRPGMQQLPVISFDKGLVWGLVHREDSTAAFDQERVQYEEKAPSETGLNISLEYPWPTNEDLYDDADWLVADFEQEFGSLGNLPRELEEFAQAGGWLRRSPRSTPQTEPPDAKAVRALNLLRFDWKQRVVATREAVWE